MKLLKQTIISAIVLAIAVCCIYFLPIEASAEILDSGTCGENLIWRLDNKGTLLISGTGEMEDYYLDYSIMPPWHSYRSKIKTVAINDGVSNIGREAFYGCTKLEKISIPESIADIGDWAFTDCAALPEIVIPENTNSIGWGAFWNCKSIISVTIPNSIASIGEYAFRNCTGLKTVNFNATNCTKIGVTDYWFPAFDGCVNIETVNIGENVEILPDYAFYGCTGLTEITIPGNVTSIGKQAFGNCTGLTTVNYNATSCTYMGALFDYYVFYGCTNLETVNIGENVEMLPDYAFYGCVGLTEITIPENITSIGGYAFGNCTGLKTVNFNATNCTYMGTEYNYYVFDGCTNLETVNIGENVEMLPDYAFYGCTGLTEITIPENVTSIGEYAFAFCTGLTTVDFNATRCIEMGSIDNPVFYRCDNIEVVKIGKNVETIPNYAFMDCTGLTKITIPENITNIGYYAFRNCKSLMTVNFNAINCTQMSSLYPSFSATNIKRLVIGKKVQTIPNNAFYAKASIQEVVIPESVTKIGEKTFQYCSGLQKVYYTGTKERWETIIIGANNEDLLNAEIVYEYVSGIAGDVDGNETITDADAVYLLYHTFLPDAYPVDQDCDFNGDGVVTDQDAVYLLYHTFLPDQYPIG